MNTGESSAGPSLIERLALITSFLLAGTLGHDAWKQDETYSFGIIYHFYTTHTWLVPVNAGMPFMEKPPLYYWTAVLFMRVFGSVLELQDAARMASVFFMAVACIALAATSRLLFRDYTYKRDMVWVTLALFLGSLGLVRHAHDLFTDVAQLAGTCVAILGVTVLIHKQRKHWMRAGALLGAGVGITFLSKGIFMPMILGAAFAASWVVLPALRTKKAAGALCMAFLIASPFLFIWPGMLYAQSPKLFHLWFWDNNIGRFLGYTVDKLGASNKPAYILYTVLWFAFPAFPLACATLIGNRHEWHRPEYIFPLSIVATGLAVLMFSASARALYLLPVTPAIALLGTQSLMEMRRGIPAWNWFVRVLASIGAVIIATVWICLLHPQGPQPFRLLYRDWMQPGIMPGMQWAAIACALVLLGLWLASFRLDIRSPLNTAFIWLSGITLLWGLGFTLLLPWINETRSFREVFTDLSDFVSRPPYSDTCISRFYLGESAGPMWEYFGQGRGLGPIDNFNHGQACKLLLTINGKGLPPWSDPRWRTVWKGSRLLDDENELQLFEWKGK